MKILFSALVFMVSILAINAQNVGINITDPEVELDVRSVVHGADINLSNSNQSDFLRFYSNTKTNLNPAIWWKNGKQLSFSLGDENGTNFNDFIGLNGKTIGVYNTGGSIFLGEGSGQTDDGSENRNIGIGNFSLKNITTGNRNVAIGDSTLYTSDTGMDNVAIGSNSMQSNTDGRDNVSVGSHALISNTMGEDNTALGKDALFYNTVGSSNVAIGRDAMYHNVDGSTNTIVGIQAGRGSSGMSYSGNVFLGFNAGRNETLSNRLYIDNSSTANPLIYGEFDNNHVKINGSQDLAGTLNITQGGVALRLGGDETLWYNGSYISYGYGANHNYMAKPLRVGPTEGSVVPFADLHIVDAVDANVSVEAQSGDAVLQLTGNSNDPNNDWTIRRQASNGGMTWKNDNIHRMTLTSGGKLLLGTEDSALGYKLCVDGKIIAEEVRVQLFDDWPDYVFQDDYELLGLDELERKIKEAGHLPGIPSAQEVAEEGIELGDMQRRLLEKVEELTLYTIELEKRIKELEKGE